MFSSSDVNPNLGDITGVVPSIESVPTTINEKGFKMTKKNNNPIKYFRYMGPRDEANSSNLKMLLDGKCKLLQHTHT